jgi:hypothetical protein
MYDVTAVTTERDYVPLTADSELTAARFVARYASKEARYDVVLIKVASTGATAETYVNGVRQAAGLNCW